jgi:hypothetical protein
MPRSAATSKTKRVVAKTKAGTKRKPASKAKHSQPSKARVIKSKPAIKKVKKSRAPSEALTFSYMNMIVPHSPPTAADWKRIETRIDAALPPDYKAFIIKQNGGIPSKCVAAFGGHEFWIETFYHVGHDVDDGYNCESQSTWVSEALGVQALAIAGDGSGDQLVLQVSKGKSQIMWWAHDAEDDKSMLPIATSFTDLLARLEAAPQEE